MHFLAEKYQLGFRTVNFSDILETDKDDFESGLNEVLAA